MQTLSRSSDNLQIRTIRDDKSTNVSYCPFLHFSFYSVTQLITTHPVCKHSEDELSGQERVQDSLDDAEVGGQRDVGLKAHVRELGLGRDMDRHVLPVSEVHRILQVSSTEDIGYYDYRPVTILFACSSVSNAML